MYGGVATEEGLDAYDEVYSCDPYACCEPFFYLSVFGGYAGLDLDGQAVERGVLNPTTGTYDMGSGYGLGVALGQTQGANLRSELEFAFRSNKGEVFRLSDTPNLVDLGGNVDTYSGMLNFIWDFNSMEWFPRVRPYLGAGLGFTFVNSDLTTDTGMALHSPQLGDNSSFAYQVMLGTTFQYSNSINWFVEYRYFGADSIKLESNPDPTHVLFGDFELKSNNVFAGIRLSF
jgi:opacity protein-like surface antigen